MKTEPIFSVSVLFPLGIFNLTNIWTSYAVFCKERMCACIGSCLCPEFKFGKCKNKRPSGFVCVLKTLELSGSDFKDLKVLACKFYWILVLGSPWSFTEQDLKMSTLLNALCFRAVNANVHINIWCKCLVMLMKCVCSHYFHRQTCLVTQLTHACICTLSHKCTV